MGVIQLTRNETHVSVLGEMLSSTFQQNCCRVLIVGPQRMPTTLFLTMCVCVWKGTTVPFGNRCTQRHPDPNSPLPARPFPGQGSISVGDIGHRALALEDACKNG